MSGLWSATTENCCPSIKKVLKVLDGQVNSEQFSIESAIPGFGRFQFAREVGQ